LGQPKNRSDPKRPASFVDEFSAAFPKESQRKEERGADAKGQMFPGNGTGFRPLKKAESGQNDSKSAVPTPSAAQSDIGEKREGEASEEKVSQEGDEA
jgi:hypothetical protein